LGFFPNINPYGNRVIRADGLAAWMAGRRARASKRCVPRGSTPAIWMASGDLSGVWKHWSISRLSMRARTRERRFSRARAESPNAAGGLTPILC